MIYQKIKSSVYILVLIAITTACNNPKGTKVSLDNIDSVGSESTDTIRKTSVKLQPCYLATIGKDSAFLKISVSDSTQISGELHYKFRERDNTYGEFKGVRRNDTLTIDYDYLAEGVKSVREITFLVRDEQIIEGIGDYKEENRKQVYQNKAQIDYTGKSFVFLPSECSKNDNGKVKRKEGNHL